MITGIIQKQYIDLMHNITPEQLKTLTTTEAAKFLDFFIVEMLKKCKTTREAHEEIFKTIVTFANEYHLENSLKRLEELVTNPQTYGDAIEIHLLLFFILTQDIARRGYNDKVDQCLIEIKNMLDEARKIEQQNEEYEKFAYKFKR